MEAAVANVDLGTAGSHVGAVGVHVDLGPDDMWRLQA